MPEVAGLESPLVNEVALSSKWNVVRAWFWKRAGHINVLELASTVSLVQSVADQKSSVRFVSLVDSAVCRGALTKGRSASRALQPGLRRLGALCVTADLYPAWNFCPTRLNTADDPTRSVALRSPVELSLLTKVSEENLQVLASGGFKRFAANWIRLVLLAHLFLPVSAMKACDGLMPWILTISASQAAELLPVVSVGVLGLLGFVCLFSVSAWIFSGGGRDLRSFRPCPSRPVRLLVCAMALSWIAAAEGMPLSAQTAAERQRVVFRESTVLQTTRAIRQQTRDRRRFYLERFQKWLFQERGVSLRFLLENKPPDPERIAGLLVEYGKEMFYAGKAYGIFAETINAIAVERPLIRRQLIQAWDLAFAWLVDEPYSHHPAMPLSVMIAMVTTAMTWGWAHEAAIILLAWTGIMRIGEVLSAFRSDLVLPQDAAPGTSFLLVMIRQPKTRARAAKHQAARVDQIDVIRYITAMYGSSPKDTKLWPFSAATLRKRFQNLLAALGLPTTKVGAAKPFDLGSLRPGGASWLLHQVEDSEIIRRRGRWLTTKAMEVYLQESFVSTFLRTLDGKTRTKIETVSGGFPLILEKTIGFLNGGIPPRTWYSLLKMTARTPTESTGKNGASGGKFCRKSNNIWLLRDVNSLHSSKKAVRLSCFSGNQSWFLHRSSLPPYPKPQVQSFQGGKFCRKSNNIWLLRDVNSLHSSKKAVRLSYIYIYIYGFDDIRGWPLAVVAVSVFFLGPRKVTTHFWNSLALQAFGLFQWYRLLTALQNDDKRRVVQLSLTGCCTLTKNHWAQTQTHLLLSIEWDAWCKVLWAMTRIFMWTGKGGASKVPREAPKFFGRLPICKRKRVNSVTSNFHGVQFEEIFETVTPRSGRHWGKFDYFELRGFLQHLPPQLQVLRSLAACKAWHKIHMAVSENRVYSQWNSHFS